MTATTGQSSWMSELVTGAANNAFKGLTGGKALPGTAERQRQDAALNLETEVHEALQKRVLATLNKPDPTPSERLQATVATIKAVEEAKRLGRFEDLKLELKRGAGLVGIKGQLTDVETGAIRDRTGIGTEAYATRRTVDTDQNLRELNQQQRGNVEILNTVGGQQRDLYARQQEAIRNTLEQSFGFAREQDQLRAQLIREERNANNNPLLQLIRHVAAPAAAAALALS